MSHVEDIASDEITPSSRFNISLKEAVIFLSTTIMVLIACSTTYYSIKSDMKDMSYRVTNVETKTQNFNPEVIQLKLESFEKKQDEQGRKIDAIFEYLVPSPSSNRHLSSSNATAGQ